VLRKVKKEVDEATEGPSKEDAAKAAKGKNTF
jgi:hypothetical protein